MLLHWIVNWFLGIYNCYCIIDILNIYKYICVRFNIQTNAFMLKSIKHSHTFGINKNKYGFRTYFIKKMFNFINTHLVFISMYSFIAWKIRTIFIFLNILSSNKSMTCKHFILQNKILLKYLDSGKEKKYRYIFYRSTMQKETL